MYLSGQAVVGVGVVHPARGDVEQLLAVPGGGVGQVDDVEDLGPAEAGDLDSAYARQVRASPGEAAEYGARLTSRRWRSRTL
jgi:hypothetical protein